MIGYIYKITNPKGKIYIGQTISLEHRIWAYSSCNCKKQIKLYNSIKKYGWENHNLTVLKIVLEEELNIAERYYQDIFNVLSKNGLNCRLTGTKELSGKINKETILKRKEYWKNNPRTHSEETKLKMSISRSGRKNNGKQIYNSKKKIIYKSIREAALDININSQTLTNMLNGRQKNKYPYLEVLPPK